LLDLADSDATLPVAAKAGVNVLAQALEGLDTAINALENEIIQYRNVEGRTRRMVPDRLGLVHAIQSGSQNALMLMIFFPIG
jgi:hypothetical protein